VHTQLTAATKQTRLVVENHNVHKRLFIEHVTN